MNWAGPLLAACLGFGLASAAIPLLIPLAHRYGWLDRPGGRKAHGQPTPLLGGVALYLAVLPVAALLAPGFSPPLYWAASGALAVGLLDDWRKCQGHDLRPGAKLILQLMPTALFIGGGGRIHYLRLPIGRLIYLKPAVDALLTSLWLVGITNTVNFIDGLDGLAGSLSAIGALTLLFAGNRVDSGGAPIWLAALVGGCLGFLRYNRPPARLFMGDGGSNFLGFVLAALSIEGYFKRATLIGLLLPFFALGVPLFNGLFVILRRFALGRKIYEADREHAFDYLLHKGVGKVETLWVFIVLALLLSASGVALALYGP